MKRFVSSKRFEAATAAGVLFLALGQGVRQRRPSSPRINLPRFRSQYPRSSPSSPTAAGTGTPSRTEIWWAEENCTAAQITTIIFLLSEQGLVYNPFD